MEPLNANEIIKVVKSESEYHAALLEIEKLMELDPDRETPEADRLDLLTLLVQEYESKTFKREPPDPIEAIQFRMEQQNLTPRDLIPYVGSRSKVSEVLSRRRPLTLSMIRALHTGLGIPARVLLKESPADAPPTDWNRFPIREMIARNWIKTAVSDVQNNAENLLCNFFGRLTSEKPLLALYRKTHHMRSARPMDDYALIAWTARIMLRANENPPAAKYVVGSVNLGFMQNLAKLSWSDTGPLLAKEFLRNHGISLIVEPHLPHTHLDGAAVLIEADRPIIGLTLRHDRVDNFWFTLMHELAHLSLHLNEETLEFFDDLDFESQNDPQEKAADDLAGEALIPQKEWEQSAAVKLYSPQAAEHLAKKLQIHPAIVAGRMRHEFKAYRRLNQLVGHKQVRKHFPEFKWEN